MYACRAAMEHLNGKKDIVASNVASKMCLPTLPSRRSRRSNSMGQTYH